MSQRKIVVVVGTRPEAIKMAPVIHALRRSKQFACQVVATAQHRELMDQALWEFDIEPDLDLDMMRANQSLSELTSRLLTAFEQTLLESRPDAVLAQGDTTTVLAVALSCFYQQIPFGHVEAGLRTGDIANPFPEELNRTVASRIAKWHFAPTQKARHNLLREGIAEQAIHVTGNTVIDALLHSLERPHEADEASGDGQRVLLVTLHRRESFGVPLLSICTAIRSLVERNDDIRVIFPVHPNPNVKGPVESALGGHPRIELCPPRGYHRFIRMMKSAYLVLSDSGGIQEEAPALGIPVLVLRNETERQEAIEHGMVKLVGTGSDDIVQAVQQLLDDANHYAGMIRQESPYGDGNAAERIVQILAEYFSTCA
ncbi:non-hydrolyzing UDP-N-acetylglucosamine 2-epimerase [Pseudomonas sp. Mn2068]|uniref:non-hydrolyzing UDP-N-acetylglucosamine 2-epimerase n=1 Tax=Pseudomonas sp. Mn2068 TaxID=3395265 RepID=UPI003BDABCA9